MPYINSITNKSWILSPSPKAELGEGPRGPRPPFFFFLYFQNGFWEHQLQNNDVKIDKIKYFAKKGKMKQPNLRHLALFRYVMTLAEFNNGSEDLR